MPGESLTYNIFSVFMSDHIVEPETNPLKFCRVCMYPHWVIVTQRCVVLNSDLNDRVYKPVFFNLPVWICSVTHQGSPGKFEISKVVGVVYDLRTVRIGIKNTVSAPVPDQSTGLVSYISVIVGKRFRYKRFRPHIISSYILLKTTHELQPPKPNEFFKINSWLI